MQTREKATLLALLMFFTASASASNFNVGIGDDCPAQSYPCFWPDSLTIQVGDSVTFYIYASTFSTGPHNVVADDGSFRCAQGCDGEGGDGTPRDYDSRWSFSRTFTTPGIVYYHDEVSQAAGKIVVLARSGFSIGPGITGAWYDPVQSGHGLFVEVLPGNRIYAGWFTFDPAGTSQAWFEGVGTYAGDTATITAMEQPTGGRWIPNFDPAAVVRNPWGTLTFTFSDCNHGRVDFASTAPGYGSGSMNLTRLTEPSALTCP